MAGGEDPDNRHDFPGGFGQGQHGTNPPSAFTAATRTPTQQELFAWTAGLLGFRAAHAEFATGIEQNLAADADSFAFVRSPAATGCAPDHGSERILIVVNKSATAKPLTLPTSGTALEGCTQFATTTAAPGPAPTLASGSLNLRIPASTLALYTVR